ncbi:hypothetical protein RZS08_11730, partial [Arthrospira platensis SPKY1]|nr:hypothetical protein [Arthrospira platensis SPKY1]
LAIAGGDRDLAVLWRDKLPTKTLYFLPKVGLSGSPPSPRVAASEESEPLIRLQVSQQDDVTYLLWLGEKGLYVQANPESEHGPAGETAATPPPQIQEPYHLYFRYTEDGGKTFSPVERVLPGYYPTWIVDRKAIPVFSWTEFEGHSSVVMRVFDRIQKRFGPPVKIADAPPISPIYQAFESA